VRPEGLGKFKNSPDRVSNPRLSGLYSALTTTLPLAPYHRQNLLYSKDQLVLFLSYSNGYRLNAVPKESMKFPL
jgi:hypothetical protein